MRSALRRLGPALPLVLALAVVVRGDNAAQILPFSQDWSNIGLITVSDDWSGVPGISGYRGDNLTAVTGADPQTILAPGIDPADTPAGVVDVNANQTNPNTFTSGGVAEFEITNPVVALQGSGTADAPFIVLHLNTSGQSGIRVTYNLRDIDGSTDDAIQPVALQYRVGSSGNFTNIPAGYVADATRGPSLATLVTPVDVILPAVCDNQPLVEVRIITTNAVGNDEWVGIDDIVVQAGFVGLSINDVSALEGDAGTATFTFTVSLSAPAPVGGVTFDIATADNSATAADNDYVAKSLLGQTIAAGNTTYTFDVTVNGDFTIEPNESFFVNVSNVVGTGIIVTDSQGLGTISNDDVVLTAIHDIQGSGASSPLVGNAVTTRGVVTGVKSNGFFVQEPDATADANPLTSEGIFVFTSSAPPAAAALGNLVQVGGTVSEFVPSSDPLQPPMTELTSPSVVVIMTGQPQPAAIPLTSTFPDPAGAVDQLERLEGMRVSVSSLTVIGPTLGSVDEPSATATTTGVFYGVVTGVARPFREPGIPANDPPPAGTIPPIPRFDANPERIRVDSDGQTGALPIDVGTGAVVTGLVGPLDYSFRTYTILPDAGTPPGVTGGPTPAAVATPAAAELTVASYNLERFFDDVNDPAIGEPVLTATAFGNRLKKASLAIRDSLKTPDILGVQEVENLATLQTLAARISTDAAAAAQPDPLYVAYLVEGNDVGGIDVGFLVKTAFVSGSTPRVFVNTVIQERAGTLFVNPDTTTALLNDRPPLRLDAVVNHASGASFPLTVIVNHLRSLNGVNDTAPGSNGWTTEGDRVRAKRLKQAEDLASLVQARQTAAPAERIILVGDFNAFGFNDGLVDSIGVIKGTPTPDNETAVPGDGVDLVNPDLVELTTPAAERYSFVFDGNAQALDHVLVNQPLVAATLAQRLEHARIGADFPETARNDTTNAVRLSDHDPAVAYFAFVLPSVSIGDVSEAEGNSGSATTQLVVTLSAPATATTTVNWATTPNSATSPSDYVTSSGVVTFNMGESQKTIDVSVNGDTTFEANETFFVNLSSPSGATISDGQGVATITNDDPMPVLVIGDAARKEGNAGMPEASFTVTLAPASGVQATVAFNTSPGTATAGTDYVTTNGSLTFDPGETTKSVPVELIGDTLNERPETFSVTLSGANNATILDGTGAGTIRDDEDEIVQFDADTLSDLTVFHPASGLWYMRNSTDGAVSNIGYGGMGYVTVPGDYDGDGITDVAVYHPPTGLWYIRNSTTMTTTTIGFGGNGYAPVRGDFDGDGKTDLAVFHDASGLWYIRNSSNGAVSATGYGGTGYVPVPGDYDGDGITDLGVYHPPSGNWFTRASSTMTTTTTGFGGSGYAPVRGDFDGDGKTDLAVFHAASGLWYIRNSATGMVVAIGYGGSGYTPVPGRYDADGKTDLAAYHEPSGLWFMRSSISGSSTSVGFGGPGFSPVN